MPALILNMATTNCTLKKTTVVQIRKRNGETVTDCDVYVGGKVDNSSWQLEESKWNNPFHGRYAYPQDLEQYSSMIDSTPRLKDDIRSLVGKRLGCFCKTGDLRCHATVLVKKADAYQRENANFHVYPKQNVIYFKGSKSVLSNFFPCKLEVEGDIFYGLAHAYAYKQALAYDEKFLAKKILRCDNSVQAYSLISTVIKERGYCWGNKRAILTMWELMQAKWEHCEQFRSFILAKLKGRFPIEATISPFWGAGKDISEISPTLPFKKQVRGQNLLGWIIYCTYLEKTDPDNVDNVLSHVLSKYDKSSQHPLFNGLRLVISTLYTDDHHEEEGTVNGPASSDNEEDFPVLRSTT